MGLSDIAALISQASPWLVAAFLAAWLTNRVLDHRERMRDGSEAKALQDELDGMAKQIGTVSRTVVKLSTEYESDRQAAARNADQSQAYLKRLVTEIVNLSAAMPGSQKVSPVNSRLMIEYQWAWCRDESIRLLTMSIEKNHFKGNEELVTRKVLRNWRAAAQDSLESLQRLEGLRYDVSVLYAQWIPWIHRKAWRLAIPILHRDYEGSSAEAVVDLQGRVKDLFNRALNQFVADADDLDVVATTRTPRPGSALAFTIPLDAEETDAEFIEKLKRYQRGKQTPSGLFDIDEEIQRHSKTLTPSRAMPAMKQPKSPY